jgi:2-oxoglutarate dehydrogenase E2 component (dihydrolipoamide succinyltransferase)
MATEIRVPTLGESVTEATIGNGSRSGRHRQGDGRAAGRTGNRQGDGRSAGAGRRNAGEILAKEGETVEVNALLGRC